MDGALAGGIHKASGWSIALGVIMILLGIVAMFAPWEFGLLIVLVVGWSAIFNGGAQIFYAFGTHKGGGRIALEILLGLIYIIAGIYLLMHPQSGLFALTLVLAAFLLVYGVIAAGAGLSHEARIPAGAGCCLTGSSPSCWAA